MANTVVVTGRLTRVDTCCAGGDVQFWLEGYDNAFYINRGLEAGFDLETFQAEVALGTEVQIRAYRRYLRLWQRRAVPAAEVTTADTVYFSRMPRE